MMNPINPFPGSSNNLPIVTAIVAVMNSLLRRLDLDGGITDLLDLDINLDSKTRCTQTLRRSIEL